MEVHVTDSGAGMSKEQVAKLFCDGVQFNVNELQAGNGSGLGLYIAKGIVEQHGGVLSASSEGLGLGTTFTLTLPLYHIPDEIKKKKTGTNDSCENEGVDAKTRQRQIQSTFLNILIVDDAGSNRKLLRRILANHGHSTAEAEDGRKAIDEMEKARDNGKSFDCILLDYEMPNMNGPDACKEMRSRGCDSFIVGVTGNMMAEDVAIFKECGANSVLPKPFRLAQLDQLWLEHGVLGSQQSESDTQSELQDEV
jgi:CheY-like chemotaxis protein